jgi:hypothetical protein
VNGIAVRIRGDGAAWSAAVVLFKKIKNGQEVPVPESMLGLQSLTPLSKNLGGYRYPGAGRNEPRFNCR